MKNKTILIINGGVLQDVITTDKNHKFILIDWDQSAEGSGGDVEQKIYPTIKLEKDFKSELVEIRKEIQKENFKINVDLEDLRGEYESTYLAYMSSDSKFLNFKDWLRQCKNILVKLPDED